MNWLSLILQTVLPIALNSSHPHAPEANTIASDAHAVAAQPKPAESDLLQVVLRSLALQLKAQAVSGAAPTPATQATISLLSQLVSTQPAAPAVIPTP